MNFYVGQTVTFTSNRGKRAGQVYTGTVTKVGSLRRGRRRYTVETAEGGTFTVPGAMLSPAKLDDSTRDKLLAEGRSKNEERRSNRAKRNAKRAEALAPYCEDFSVGERVEVISRRCWQPATIVSIDTAKGKITVTNPAKALEAAFGPVDGRRFKATITVLANRVRKAV